MAESITSIVIESTTSTFLPQSLSSMAIMFANISKQINRDLIYIKTIITYFHELKYEGCFE